MVAQQLDGGASASSIGVVRAHGIEEGRASSRTECFHDRPGGCTAGCVAAGKLDKASGTIHSAEAAKARGQHFCDVRPRFRKRRR